jgi:hypothetical protein
VPELLPFFVYAKGRPRNLQSVAGDVISRCSFRTVGLWGCSYLQVGPSFSRLLECPLKYSYSIECCEVSSHMSPRFLHFCCLNDASYSASTGAAANGKGLHEVQSALYSLRKQFLYEYITAS